MTGSHGHTLRIASLILLMVLLVVGSIDAQQKRKDGGRAKKGGHGPTEFHTDVPPHAMDLVLGRPTKDSITLSVLAYQDLEGFVAYGTEPGGYTAETPKQVFQKGQPVEVRIGSLQPNTRYYYQFRSRALGAGEFSGGTEGTFHTARPPGSTFTFVVQADSHLDENVSPERYHQSVRNALSDRPDFLVDLGDTFMTGKYGNDRLGAEKQHLAQRYYFGIVGSSAPVFLVIGNHDGEDGGERRLDAGGNSPGVWANLTRKKYFPNPIPDNFYTGNGQPHPRAGLLQDYYAWEWGNALFVVLDPYWFSTRAADNTGENWNRSLGREQYDWLRRTLETSKRAFKFVFIHQLVGGTTPQGRGGAEAAAFYEWGGRSSDGSDGFRQNRPGWPQPIHDLLREHGVTIVFHGHDHLFAHQERDGLVYQCVPQPGNRPNGVPPRSATEYGYRSGEILGSPGYMRITVAPDKVTAELIRSYLPEDESGGRKNHEVGCTYTIPLPARTTAAAPISRRVEGGADFAPIGAAPPVDRAAHFTFLWPDDRPLSGRIRQVRD